MKQCDHSLCNINLCNKRKHNTGYWNKLRRDWNNAVEPEGWILPQLFVARQMFTISKAPFTWRKLKEFSFPNPPSRVTLFDGSVSLVAKPTLLYINTFGHPFLCLSYCVETSQAQFPSLRKGKMETDAHGKCLNYLKKHNVANISFSILPRVPVIRERTFVLVMG